MTVEDRIADIMATLNVSDETWDQTPQEMRDALLAQHVRHYAWDEYCDTFVSRAEEWTCP